MYEDTDLWMHVDYDSTLIKPDSKPEFTKVDVEMANKIEVDENKG